MWKDSMAICTARRGTFPKVKMNFRPTLCNHCAEPACVANCPTGAMAKREDNGAVVVDQDVCIGVRHLRELVPLRGAAD